MNKKGFTLIELLVVIVILALLMVVSSSIINNTLGNTKTKLMEIEAKKLLKAAYEEYQTKEALGEKYVPTSDKDGEFEYEMTIDGNEIRLEINNKELLSSGSSVNIKTGKIALSEILENKDEKNTGRIYNFLKIYGGNDLGKTSRNLVDFSETNIVDLIDGSSVRFGYFLGELGVGQYSFSYKSKESFPHWVYLYTKGESLIGYGGSSNYSNTTGMTITDGTTEKNPRVFSATGKIKYAIAPGGSQGNTYDLAKAVFDDATNYQLIKVENGVSSKEYRPYRFIDILVDGKVVQTIDMTGIDPLECNGNDCDYIDFINKQIVRKSTNSAPTPMPNLKSITMKIDSVIVAQDDNTSYQASVKNGKISY